VVIHSYLHRVRNAPGEVRFKAVEEKLAKRPKIEVPATLLYRSDDFLGGAAPEVKQTERNQFPMLRARRVIPGDGAFPAAREGGSRGRGASGAAGGNALGRR
jgi:hypothetical protein